MTQIVGGCRPSHIPVKYRCLDVSNFGMGFDHRRNRTWKISCDSLETVQYLHLL